MKLSEKELKNVLQTAQKLVKEEKLEKEDALDEAYRRTGKGKK